MDYDSIRFLAQLLGEELNWERPTLRDQFAMAAMQAHIANPYIMKVFLEDKTAPVRPAKSLIAELAYHYADEMMEARK